MQTKILEIRDRATFFLVLCVDMNPDDPGDLWTLYQRKALRTYGFPCDNEPNILMTHLRGDDHATNDPYHWGDRTKKTAHNFIIQHWNELQEGDVIDVEFILGETKEKKISQFEERAES